MVQRKLTKERVKIMYSIKEIYKNKINFVTTQEKLNKLNKKKKIWAFVNKTLFIIDLIQTRQNQKNNLHLSNQFKRITSGEYSYISRDEFLKGFANDQVMFNDCMKYLKNEGLVECKKVNGVEYYIHWQNKVDMLDKCPKAYKLTDKCKQIFSNTSQEEFDAFIDSIKVDSIPRRRYTPTTPKEKVQKVKCEYWFKNTKENIIHVFNNNLELEFQPTSIKELVDLYNKQRIDQGEKTLSRTQIEEEIAKKIDEYANKDFSYNVRLYSAFTNTPKSWRRFVRTKEGNSIKELFDIPSSIINILPIVCRIELLKNECTKEQYEKFLDEEKMLNSQLEKRYDKVNPVHIYEIIGNGIWSKQQIKDSVMTVFFSNNKSFENIANIEKTVKGKIKNTSANAVRMWLKNNYPIMFDIVSHFEQKYDKSAKGYKKFKSQFWKAFQSIETEIMCELNVRVEKKFGLKVYNLHDGCFMDALYSTETSDEMVEFCRSQFNFLKQGMNMKIDEKYCSEKPVKSPVVVEKPVVVQQAMKPVNNERETIRKWLVETNTSKEQLKEFDEDKNMYDLFKIAYEYGTGQIKSTRDM